MTGKRLVMIVILVTLLAIAGIYYFMMNTIDGIKEEMEQETETTVEK